MERNIIYKKNNIMDKILFYSSIGAIVGYVFYLITLICAGIQTIVLPIKAFAISLVEGGGPNYFQKMLGMIDGITGGINNFMSDLTKALKAVALIKVSGIIMLTLSIIFVIVFIVNIVKKSTEGKNILTFSNIIFAGASLSFIISSILLSKLLKISSLVASADYTRLMSDGYSSSDSYYMTMFKTELMKLNIANYNPTFGVILFIISFVLLIIGATAIYNKAYKKVKIIKKRPVEEKDIIRENPVQKQKVVQKKSKEDMDIVEENFEEDDV